MNLNVFARPLDEDQKVSVSTGLAVDNGVAHLTTKLSHSRQPQKQQVEQASHIERRMERLLEVLPGGVIILDGDGCIQQCNTVAVQVLGESLENKVWSDVIDRVFAPKLDDGENISLKDGRLLYISTSPLEDEPGQIVLLQDVTETRQLQQKISHLQRLSAMGEVAARLAHQIRTPLSSALLYLSPLLKENTERSIQKRFAQKLHTSISHMEQLVKDMLAFSRGDMTVTEPVRVADLLWTVEQQFRSTPNSEKYHLQVQNSAKNSYVYGSKDALASAVNNLMNNARTACESEGEITLFADHIIDDGIDYIEITVEDNGMGIAEEDKDKVLTPFFTTRSSGTGLGLAVVQSVVQAHKGKFWFESDEGEGCTFCMRLPMYQAADNFVLTAQK